MHAAHISVCTRIAFGSFHQVGASFVIGVPCYVGIFTIRYHSL